MIPPVLGDAHISPLLSMEDSHKIYCPRMSLRGWRKALAAAKVGEKPVAVRIGERRIFVNRVLLERWLGLESGSREGGR